VSQSHNVLLNELRATSRGFLNAVADLTPPQWQFRTGPDQWSISETAEHVTIVESNIHRLLTTRLLNLPATPEQRAEMNGKDVTITTAMFDRSVRRPSPEMVRPSGRWPVPSAMIQMFQESREGLMGWLEQTEADLRGFCAPHPALGLLDGKQWLLFVAAHVERHTRQILEIKEQPGFPV
jgi:hypothetical protein